MEDQILEYGTSHWTNLDHLRLGIKCISLVERAIRLVFMVVMTMPMVMDMAQLEAQLGHRGMTMAGLDMVQLLGILIIMVTNQYYLMTHHLLQNQGRRLMPCGTPGCLILAPSPLPGSRHALI